MSKPDSPHPDQKYIQALLHNDNIGIQEIYAKFSPMVIKLVTSNSGSVGEAKDLMQDALIAIFHHAQGEDFVLTCPFGPYLYSICQKRWLNVLRRKKRHRVTIEKLEVSESEPSIEILTIALQRQEGQRQFLWKKFEELSERCRELLRVRWEGHEWREVAEYFDLQEGYVRKKGMECWHKLVSIIQADAQYAALKE